MATTFPLAPTNGQVAIVNGRSYTWNSTLVAWQNTGSAQIADALASLNVSGTVTASTVDVSTAVAGSTTTTNLTVNGSPLVTGSYLRISNTGYDYYVGLGTSLITGATTADLGIRSGGSILFSTAGSTARMILNTSGHLLPWASNTYDLGGTSNRWRNIYTQDLHLSNGIGDYTIVEGEEDLFLVNNKNGKHYKFALIEVDPSLLPPRSEEE